MGLLGARPGAEVLAQAAYHILTGLWPIVSIEALQKVTGPKRE